MIDLAHDALFFALPFAFFFGMAFVVLRFTARQCDFTFDFAVFVMQIKRNEGEAALLDFANQAFDFIGFEQ